MNTEIAVKEQNVHVREFLTQNILVEATDPDGNKRWQINTQGQWAVIMLCTVTVAVQARLDEGAGPACFHGHFTVESSPFFLQEYVAYGALINTRLRSEIKSLVEDKKYSPITEPPISYRVDIEPLLERKYVAT